MKQTKIQNQQIINIARFLKKASKENDASIWKRIANTLLKTRSRRVAVNLSRINRYSKKDTIIVVPGKVLGAGSLNHPVTITAFSYSRMAKNKIGKAKGKLLSFQELVETNPKGSNVKIVG